MRIILIVWFVLITSVIRLDFAFAKNEQIKLSTVEGQEYSLLNFELLTDHQPYTDIMYSTFYFENEEKNYV